MRAFALRKISVAVIDEAMGVWAWLILRVEHDPPRAA
jgi:hypothetical protein